MSRDNGYSSAPGVSSLLSWGNIPGTSPEPGFSTPSGLPTVASRDGASSIPSIPMYPVSERSTNPNFRPTEVPAAFPAAERLAAMVPRSQ